VGIGDVDVVLFRDSGRAVAHQFGERVPIHATLGAAGAECVPPTVKRETIKASFADRPPMGLLDADQMP
jgi:hypothetical protein